MFIEPSTYKYDSTEMDKLAKLLTENGVEFTRRRIYNGEQILCDHWDAICHEWSYGGASGLLEIMGAIVDPVVIAESVEGYLTAEEVFEKFKQLQEYRAHHKLGINGDAEC